MTLFFAYLKQHRRGILAFLLFIVLFVASFALYRLPMAAVIYPAMLCGAIGAVFVIFDFVRALQRHRRFEKLKELTASMMDSLPKPRTIGEADFSELIDTLKEEISGLERGSAERYRDMVEYYTLWAHQIKTPISSMRLALQNEDTPLARRLSGDLNRVEQYVEMVLAFLRLDSDSSDYVFAEHSLDDILKASIAKFAPEFIDRKLRLEYEPTEQRVVTDEKWLGFVIEQVLSNALKYTREGSIKIYMKGKTLVIEDTGIGIAPEDLPRVFEKGYTGYNGRLDKRASGIGLYLCKRICKSLGAEISIASEPGKGTAVSVDLSQYELRGE